MSAAQAKLEDVFRSVSGGRVALVLMALCLIVFVAVAATYAVYPGFFDHGEPIVAAAAFKLLDGRQVYDSFESETFTSNVYGPYLYLLNGLFFWLFGGSAMVSKLSGIAAVLLSIAVTFAAHRSRGSATRTALWAALVFIAYALTNIPYSIWSRPDPFLLLVAALSVFAMRLHGAPSRSFLFAATVGGLGGLACGFKMYGAVFVLPVAFWYLSGTRCLRSAAIMVLVGSAVALGPYALDVFSLSGFLEWVPLTSGKVSSLDMFVRGLRYSLFFVVPISFFVFVRIVAIRRNSDTLLDPELVYGVMALAGLSACLLLASKPGAGAYYFLPFAPIAVDAMRRSVEAAPHVSLRPTHIAVCFSLVAALMLMTSVPIQKRFYKAMHWDEAKAVSEDVRSISAKHPDKTLEMAVGDSLPEYRLSSYKALLVFDGHPYSIDFGVMIETSFLGVPVSSSVIDRIRNCGTDMWLVPRNQRPLELRGYYGNPIVTDELRKAFTDNYAPVGHSEYFDLWSCTHSTEPTNSQ